MSRPYVDRRPAEERPVACEPPLFESRPGELEAAVFISHARGYAKIRRVSHGYSLEGTAFPPTETINFSRAWSLALRAAGHADEPHYRSQVTR